MPDTLLELKDLKTSFRVAGNYYAAVDNVNLTINKNEVFAVVGESGSGKSAMAMSIMRLHNLLYTRLEGQIIFKGTDLLPLTVNEMNKYRGSQMSMVFQDALSALNPLFRIGYQIDEVLYYHTKMDAAKRKVKVLEMLDEVGIVNPELTYMQYPHELSGGMRQRIMIAMALVCEPDLVICDEPTTALDVTIQAQILDLLRNLKKKHKSSIILITHDLGVVAEMADRVAVMYAGQIVEIASVWDLFENPQHPYTRSLLESIPNMDNQVDRLHVIQGMVPPLHLMPRTGCRFCHRTPWVDPASHEEEPKYYETSPGHLVLCSCHKTFSFAGRDAEKGKVS